MKCWTWGQEIIHGFSPSSSLSDSSFFEIILFIIKYIKLEFYLSKLGNNKYSERIRAIDSIANVLKGYHSSLLYFKDIKFH